MSPEELDRLLSTNTEVRCGIIDFLLRGGPSTIKELAEGLGWNRVWIGENVAALAEAGFLSRAPLPSDRRKVVVSLKVDPQLLESSVKLREWRQRPREPINVQYLQQEVEMRIKQLASLTNLDPAQLRLIWEKLQELQELLQRSSYLH
ncbi:MAG: hypothetical protein QXH92_03455 [Candidatus Aenigmatarchaeota archaeon]